LGQLWVGAEWVFFLEWGLEQKEKDEQSPKRSLSAGVADPLVTERSVQKHVQQWNWADPDMAKLGPGIQPGWLLRGGGFYSLQGAQGWQTGPGLKSADVRRSLWRRCPKDAKPNSFKRGDGVVSTVGPKG